MSLIAIHLPDLRGGGAERLNLDLAREFARYGHAVEFVLVRAEGDLLEEARHEFPVHDLGCRRIRHVPPALAKYLRTRRPDTVLAAMWPLTVAAPLARAMSGHRCRIVVSEHNPLSIQYRSWGPLHYAGLRASAALGYRMSDARVAVSAGVAEDLSRISGMASGAFAVIHNPVPMRVAPSPDAVSRIDDSWGCTPGARVLTVGSFKSQKNQALLLHAFAQLQRSDARLMLLGQGPLEAELLQIAQSLDISDRVLFPGFHADPTPYYHTADLFVLSSDYEGFGNVIVESLMSGTPVVSTDCPSGPSEILVDGEYGTLVPVGNVDALAQAMEAALATPSDPARLHARAKHFSPERAAQAYLDLLLPASGHAQFCGPEAR